MGDIPVEADGLPASLFAAQTRLLVFARHPDGVFYFAAGTRPRTSSLRHVDGASGRIREVALLDVVPSLGLTASRDGKTILFGVSRPPNNDLYVIDDFR